MYGMVALPWQFRSSCSPLWASLALLAAPDPVSSRAHFGYPHTLNAFATCPFSFRMPSQWDTTVYAWWYRVRTALSLCSNGWALSADTGQYASVSWTHEPLICYFPRTHQRIQNRDSPSVRHRILRELQVLVNRVDVPKETFISSLMITKVSSM